MNFVDVYLFLMALIFALVWLIPAIRSARYRNELARKQIASMSELQMINLSLSQADIDDLDISQILTPECIQLHTEFLNLEEIEKFAGFSLGDNNSEDQLNKLDKLIREHSINPLINDYGQLFMAGLMMNSAKLGSGSDVGCNDKAE